MEVLRKSKREREVFTLRQNDLQLVVCRGRIQGVYAVYLPDMSTYTEKFVQEAHEAVTQW